jgi:predicted small integral membrane protein
MIFRIAKILLVASAGVQLLFVGLGNLFDYDANFQVVRHILSMDALPPGTPLSWRAITAPAAHHLCYWLIIVAELASSALMLLGTYRLTSARRLGAARFDAEKQFGAAGLTLALSLYFGGFMVVGGEWFEMWRAGPWNMQEPAFRFVGCLGLILIFLAQNESELTRAD